MVVSLGVEILVGLAPGFDDIIAICPFSITKDSHSVAVMIVKCLNIMLKEKRAYPHKHM